MLTTIRALRSLIREYGVDDTMRTQAGWVNPVGVSAGSRDREALLHPPPGLGNDQEQGDDSEDEEEEARAGTGLGRRQRGT